MHWLYRIAATFVVSVALSVTVCPAAVATTSPAASVLVFTKTQPPSSAHAVTPEALNLLEMTARRYSFSIDATDDSNAFTAENLDRYDVVMWLNTSGDVLNKKQRAAFIDWVARGGGFVGVHSAAMTHPNWKEYRDLIGANVISDEDAMTSEENVAVDTGHAATDEVPDEIESISDQWYSLDRNPGDQADTTVLATVDRGDDANQPVAWCRPYGDGRSWYTTMGHSLSTFEEGDYMNLLRGGIWWSADIQKAPKVSTTSAPPQWPYMASFFILVASVAVGGAVAVSRLNRRNDWNE